MGYLKHILRKNCGCTDCLPSPCDECCPALALRSSSRYGSATKVGLAEFQSSGPVARRYLTSTRTASSSTSGESFDPSRVHHIGGNGTPSSITKDKRTWSSATGSISTVIRVNPDTGASTTITTGGTSGSNCYSQLIANGQDDGGNQIWTDDPNGGCTDYSGGPGNVGVYSPNSCNTTTTPTSSTTACSYSSSSSDPATGSSSSSQSERNDQTVLSNEFTTAMLLAKMTSLMSAWTDFAGGGATASRSLATNELSVSGVEARFKFITDAPVPAGKKLTVHYNRIFTPGGGSAVTTPETVIIGAGATESAVITLSLDRNGTETIVLDHYECESA
jgi:hypothetical protein